MSVDGIFKVVEILGVSFGFFFYLESWKEKLR